MLSELVWHSESTAASSMIPNESNLISTSSVNGTNYIWVQNGTLLLIKRIGCLTLFTSTWPLSLINVFHVPSLKNNLIFIH